ncbi:hypothetical protein Tco_1316682 [Tanacetum coccineum]
MIPTTSSSPPKVVEHETEVTKDTVPPTNNGSTKDVQPSVVQVQPQVLNYEPVVAPVSAPKPNPKPSIPYPSRLNDQKIREKANNQIEKFYQIFQDLHFDISFADVLILMPNFASTLKSLISNKEKLFELARTPLNEHCSTVLLKKLLEKLRDPVVDFDADPQVPLILGRSFLKIERALIDVYEGELTLHVGKEAYSQEVLGFTDVIASGNPTPYYDPIVSTSSPTLTPFGDSDFLLEEVDAFLALEDDPTSPEGDDKLPVIIVKDLSVEEKAALIKVLKSHKRAIAWKFSDIKGINPEFCTHKILMEEDYKPVVQHQRRVNQKIHDVIKKEVEKLLDAELIYPISDSPWVSPVHCVPKKGGFTVVENDENELIPTRLVTGKVRDGCVSLEAKARGLATVVGASYGWCFCFRLVGVLGGGAGGKCGGRFGGKWAMGLTQEEDNVQERERGREEERGGCEIEAVGGDPVH